MNPELSHEPRLNPQPEPPAPAPQNFFSRLIGVYFSPGETFREIGRAPGVVLPIIVMVLLTVVVVVAVSQRISFEKVGIQRIDDAVAEGKITQEQADQQKDGMKKIAPFLKIFIPIFAAIFSVVLALAIAGVAKLVSSMMGIENTFMPLFAMTLYAILAVSIVSSVVAIILIYIKPVEEIDPNNPVGSNLAALLPLIGVTGLPKFVNALLTYVDVFYIWKVVLIAIGWAAVSRKMKTSTAMVYSSIGALLLALNGAVSASLFG